MTTLPAPGLRHSPAGRITKARLVALAVLAAAVVGGFAALAGAPPAPAPASKAAILESYGKLPLRFEANVGQAAGQADFIARGAASTLFVSADRARLALAGSGGDARPSVVDMQVVGADAGARPTAGRRLPGVSNYFIGRDRSRWRTGVPGFASVTYPEVYPGIDLVYHGRQSALEYDFVVAPNVDPARIALQFAGVESLRIGADGDLLLGAGSGVVRQQAPVAYQRAADGSRVAVQARYVRRSDRRVGFELGAYDDARRVIIDPVLSYASLLGGSAVDSALAVAVDVTGRAYIAGSTTSLGASPFPTTPGVQQGTSSGGTDAFVTRLSPSGSALEYSTYLGGGGTDIARGIAVEGDSAYITGETASRQIGSFPTTAGAYASSLTGDTPSTAAPADAFVARLDASGSALLYSTYLGGGAADAGRAIAVAGGVAHVTGNTASNGTTLPPAFPSQNALQPAHGGGTTDAFVVELNTNTAGTAGLEYSTFLGGGAADQGNAIAVAAGAVSVAGQTTSTNFPTQSPRQATNAGLTDAFVARYDAAGSAFAYSTYLGGTAADLATGIAVNGTSAFVTGETASDDFPTVNALQGARAGETDAFVTRFSADGSAHAYSTYLGGGSADAANAIALDGTQAVVGGSTGSTNFPAADPVLGRRGNGDGFVSKLSSNGDGLVYSTYLGGNIQDTIAGVAVDAMGNTYAAGSVGLFFAAGGQFRADDVAVRNGVPSPGALGGTDVLIAKIAPGGMGPLVTRLRPQGGSTGGGTTVTVTGRGFTGATAVRFGAAPAASFTADSDSRITAVSPPGAAIDVPVTVTVGGVSSPANPVADFGYGEGDWESAGTMTIARFTHTMTLLKDGKVLAAGGRVSTGAGVRASAEIYDPLTNGWTATGSMANARFGHSATLLDGPACQTAAPPAYCGKVLVAGGFAGLTGTNAQPVLTQAELFDPASGTFAPTAAMATRRSLHAATMLRDGRVLVAGGRTCNQPPPTACDFTFRTDTAEVYDPATGTWTATGNTMTVARHTNAAAVLPDGKVLVPAGSGASTAGTTAEIYDPVANAWSFVAAPLNQERARAGATVLADGRVLLAASFPQTSSAELFDPATRSFSATGPMTTFGRFSTYFALLPNGRVLAAGGGNGGATAEIYDPVTNGWRRAASPAGSYGTSSSNSNSVETVVLKGGPAVCGSRCGKALVAGTSDDAAAELYVPAALPAAAPPPPPPPPPPPAAAIAYPLPGAAKDTTPPVISRLRVVPSVFEVRLQSARASAAAAKGTTIRYRLSEAARVTLAIERATSGRRVGASCRKPTRSNRGRPRCTRYTRVGRLTQSGRKGENRRTFSGRLNGHALKAGSYRVVAIAHDSARNASKRRTAKLRVVRARRR